MDYLLLLLMLLILVLLALLFHKIRRIHLATFRLNKASDETFALFRQFQAYDGLMRLISPPHPLPLLRGWAASPDLLLTLAKHVLKHKPTAILECSSGSSTVVMARCCQLNSEGHVYSLENDEKFAQISRQWLEEQGLEAWATIIHAPLVPTGESGQPWYDLAKLEPNATKFDMLVIDGPPASLSPLSRYPALPQLDALLKSGAHVFLDDAARSEEVKVLQRWHKELPGYAQTVLDLDKGGAMLVKA